MDARQIAKRIVDQWDKHDKYRLADGESVLFSNGVEPDGVAVSRALLQVDSEYGCEVRDPSGTIWQHAARVEQDRDKYKTAVEQMRMLLLGVLENEELAEWFNNGNLDDSFKQQIRDAVSWKI